MIPAPGPEDGTDVHERYARITSGKSEGIGGDRYYGYEPDLLAKVRDNLRSMGIAEETHSIDLLKGLLQDTLRVHRPVAFAHIDVDWYDPVRVCLERIAPKLIVGGTMILDDFADWSGCRKAASEFMARHSDGEFRYDLSRGPLEITRMR
jgi:asparagine synthase (glutamine-hydrolysing)